MSAATSPRHPNGEAGMKKILVAAVGMMLMASTTADGQSTAGSPQVKRSGPRYGAIWLSPALLDSISTRIDNQKINSTMSLFGWEFQRELLQNPTGAAPVASLVIGVAGLDQGLVLPSASWIVGIRTREDIEIGIGPNLSLAGAALALTAGITMHSGELNIPINLAYVSSRLGTRVSVSTGFNIMK